MWSAHNDTWTSGEEVISELSTNEAMSIVAQYADSRVWAENGEKRMFWNHDTDWIDTEEL